MGFTFHMCSCYGMRLGPPEDLKNCLRISTQKTGPCDQRLDSRRSDVGVQCPQAIRCWRILVTFYQGLFIKVGCTSACSHWQRICLQSITGIDLPSSLLTLTRHTISLSVLTMPSVPCGVECAA